MGQIRGKKAHIDACNIRSLSSFGIPAAGQYILVSADNSATADGQGNFDYYVEGDGHTVANMLELKKQDDSISLMWDVLSENGTYDEESTFISKTLGSGIAPIAKIVSIKGDALVWNQLIKNGNFAENNNNWSLLNVTNVSVEDGIFTFRPNAEQTTARIYQALSLASGHKYFFRYKIRVNTETTKDFGTTTLGYINSSPSRNILRTAFTSNQWYYAATIIETPSAATQIHIGYYAGSVNLTPSDSISVGEICCFDLTKMYGSGNEPTADEFLTYFPNDYYDYNAGVLAGVSPTSLVSYVGSKECVTPLTGVELYGIGDVYDEWNAESGIVTKRIGSRAYVSGDENDTSVITDGTTTIYPLDSSTTNTLKRDTTFKAESGGVIAFRGLYMPATCIIRFANSVNSDLVELLAHTPIDDEPVAGSEKLVTSGGVYKGISQLREEIHCVADFTYDVQDNITPVSDSYVNYNTGAVVTGAGTAPEFRRFDLAKSTFGENNCIRVFSGANTTIPAAIAFYSGTPASGTYIKDASVQMSEPLNGHWYDAPIPDNAEYIVVTVGTAYATPNIQLIKIPAIPEIPDYSYLDSIVTVEDVTNADIVTNSYVNYNTGVLASAGVTSYLQRYTFPAPSGASSVRVFVAASDTIPAAIAFYSGTPASGTYIKDASVQMSEPLNGHWYDAPIPDNAEYIVVSNKFTVVEQAKIQLIYVPLYNTNREQIAKKPNFVESPFFGKPYYSHFNPIGLMVDGFGRKLIGGESLDDIRIAARLGFDFIEANLHKTSDGVVIVTHGSNGFGPAFIDLTTGLQPTQQIYDVTYDYISQNIRYDSALDKYKTPPPTIEQFLRCAKDNEIGVVLGVSGLGETSNSVLQLAKQYLNDRIIVYGTGIFRRPDGYNGYCFNWFNASSDTIDTIKGAMSLLGFPAICSCGPTTLANLESAGTLDALIEWLHDNGYLFAVAYMSETENMEYLSKGCDLIASGYQVNQFNGNDLVVDINDITPNITIVDGTLEDGVISINTGGTITIGDDDKIALGKGMLKIRFSGTITANFGSQGARQITSDGNSDVIITDYFLIRKRQIVITATSATTISDLCYQTSIC